MTIRRNQQWHPTLHSYGLLFKFSCWQTELDFDELFDWACTCERRKIVCVWRGGGRNEGNIEGDELQKFSLMEDGSCIQAYIPWNHKL
jgi:hypothetical protein